AYQFGFGLFRVDLRVRGLRGLDRRVGQPPPRLVGKVIAQYVEDEALLDGLPHRVDVERLHLAGLRIAAAEQLQRLRLGRGGEREMRQVRVPAPGQRRGSEQVAVGVDIVGAEPAERLLQRVRRLTRLRRMRLVDDDRVPALTQLGDFIKYERKLLQR